MTLKKRGRFKLNHSYSVEMNKLFCFIIKEFYKVEIMKERISDDM